MATYNGEKYIEEQIDSIRSQTFSDWRLLISDDCSQDHTLEIIEKYTNTDKRITVVSKGNRYGSAKSNFINLLSHAKAPYVMFSDQDDVWLTSKIKLTLEEMLEVEKINQKRPILIFTDMKVVDIDENIIDSSFVRYENIKPSRTKLTQVVAQSVGAGCTMMVNRSLTDMMNTNFDINKIIMHDWWMTLIASAFGVVKYVPEQTSLYRQHGDNSVGAARYSIVNKIKTISSMYKNVENTTVQAEEFIKCYRELLSRDNLNKLSKYSTIIKEKGTAGIINLLQSGCFKSGLRLFGQIYVAAKGF